jgi:delta24-sterol reductase
MTEMDTRERHQDKVAAVAKQIRSYYGTGTPFKVFHGSTNSTRILSFRKSEMVDVSNLTDVLSIDTDRRTALVESNVPMDRLVKATLAHDLLPPVVTEFPGITVGGGIQGGAGESSSFKWGFFNQAVNWVEYILADGSTIRTSPNKHADLFYGAAGSCGTLGVISAVEIQLIPAKKFVQLTYLPVTSFSDALQTLRQAIGEAHDFTDGVMFGKKHGVIITGKLTNDTVGNVQRFSRAHDPWYYLHAQKIDHTKTVTTETVPLEDYLFRYNRGAFWVGKYAFERFGIPCNACTRFLLNPILSTRKLYQALQASGASQEYLVQDLTLPIKNAEAGLEYIDKLTGIYPLWLCPIKPEPRSPLLCNGLHAPLAINVGVWGPRVTNYEEFKKINRKLEARVAQLEGKKWMYAHTYYTKEEFWRIYDKKWYDALRQKYKATTLPSVFEKVHVHQRYKVNAKHGLLVTITGRAKLRIED